MDLHHSSKTPDWEQIPAEQHNVWQKVANSSNGIVTPGNIITIAGAGLVFSGMNDIKQNRKFNAFSKIAIGRIADLADGYIANKTGTKSSKGEALDAAVDSVELALAIPMLVRREYLPMRTGLIYGIHKAVNGYASAKAKKNGYELHSSWSGKRAEAFRWGTIAFYALAKLSEDKFNNDSISKIFKKSAVAGEIISASLGTIASIGYLNDIHFQEKYNEINQRLVENKLES